jgi:hypothetical protein
LTAWSSLPNWFMVMKEPMVLAAVFLSFLTFALAAFGLDRLGYRMISAILAAGAWLFLALGALEIWFWQ